MIQLEIRCSNCSEVLTMQVTQEDYDHFLMLNSFRESSRAYKEFFECHGWVLKQTIFCDLCKYEHSEVYAGE
jgi:C4-type Zn-finger protein